MRPLHLTVLAALVAFAAGCASSQVAPAAPAAPAVAEEPHHHELHLPPVGPSVHVTLDGKAADVVLSTVPHEGSAASLVQVWKAAFPTEDPAPLKFDLVGSDGFHPASRAKCARLLTGVEIGAARIDVERHDVSFDPPADLPGCYRVKAVVSLDATR